MIRMAQQQYIKEVYENEDLSLSEIARRTKLNFRTVQKYAYKDDWNMEKLPNLQAESYPSLKEYIPYIDEWMETDRKLPRKQRHTAMRMYTRLAEEHGYTGCYSSVKRYVGKRKRVQRLAEEGYLPLAQPAGAGQVDFGESIYYDASGSTCKGYALTVSFPYSNKGYTQFFPAQNQECLLTGLRRVFEHIGGVPARLKLDNLSAAVAQVLEDGERVLTDGFRRFMLHYQFKAEFCNRAAGNEKGHVENKVGYSQRNAFVPVPTITDFEEFNSWLWEWCEKDAERLHYKYKIPICELWETDRSKLPALPEHPYEVFRYEALTVNKYGFATVDTNSYGLPPELAGEIVQAKIYFDRIEFFYDHQKLTEYKRSYGRNEEHYDWTLYIGTLLRKPGAAEHTRFFKQMPEHWQGLLRDTKGTERRNALQLLGEIVAEGNRGLCEDVLELAKDCGRTDADSLRRCYYMLSKREFRPAPVELKTPLPLIRYEPDLSGYNKLTGGASHG